MPVSRKPVPDDDHPPLSTQELADAVAAVAAERHESGATDGAVIVSPEVAAAGQAAAPRKRVRAAVFNAATEETRSRKGAIRCDPARCIGCGVCAAVCATNSISVRDSSGNFAWTHTPAACTFCTLCVRSCPASALSQDKERPTPEEQAAMPPVTLVIEYPACPSCGRPYMPASALALSRAYGELAGRIESKMPLCPTCRRERSSLATAEVRAFGPQ